MTTHAQSNTPDEEYKQLIKVDQEIHPLGAHPFGENVSLYDGTLSFEETDVSLPGNGPTIVLARSLSTTDTPTIALNAQRPFADWDLDIPRIETATANQTSGGVVGWLVQAANSKDRCSVFGPPPQIPSTQGGLAWFPNDWWYGYHLILPGQGSQDLLARTSANPLTPTISGLSFPIVTKQNWMIACGVTADDGGEGFLAIAPDGTRYTFAHLVYRPMAFMTEPLDSSPDVVKVTASSKGGIQPEVASSNILGRRDGFMYVTQVQDRFGNTLTYHYDPTSGYLTSITANDLREVDIAYVSGTPLIHSVTVEPANATPRTWTYSYDTTTDPTLPTLTGVLLPDGVSAWSYKLAMFQQAFISVSGSNCALNELGTVTQNPTTGTITTPSGLTGSFALAPTLHGRSYVLKTPTGGGAPVYSFYDQGGQLMFELTPSAAQATNFIYLGTKLIARNAYEQLDAPGAVTFDSNPNNGNYTVSWGATPVATSYVLEESANGGAWTVAYTGSATSFAFTGKAGGSYVYQVQGCDSTTGTCSAWTTSATLGVTPALPTNVTVPSSLAAVPFTVSWTAPVGATSYTVQQSFNGGTWTTVGSGITTPSFSVTSGAAGGPGGTYTYQISASNAYGTQGWVASAPVSVTQVPATPTNFAMSTANGTTVMTWDAMAWATSYNIVASGKNGHLGTYTYTVGTNTFGFPSGSYTAQQLTACSIAGCSGPLQIGGEIIVPPIGVPVSAVVTKARRLGADTSPSASAGCTATVCTVPAGGNP